MDLYWFCSVCGGKEPAQDGCVHGDSEPCTDCDGMAWVLTLPEINAMQWRCFHCGEVFVNRCDAIEHFGLPQTEAVPTCLADIAHLRKLEAELAKYRAGDVGEVRAVQLQSNGHAMNNVLDVHPSPWRVEDGRIVDARGTSIVEGGCVGLDNADLAVDEGVLPLILAVPEMLAVLRVLVTDPAGGASWAKAVQDGAAIIKK